MNEELENKLQHIADDFTINGLIWDPKFNASLEELDDQELIYVLGEIEIKAKKNFEEKIYPDSVKTNIFNILHYYRGRLHDEENLNKINDIIGYLNASTSENYIPFLANEYASRYLVFSRFTRNVNIFEFEDKIRKSIANDCVFITELLNENMEDFLFYNLCSELGYSNLSHLLDIFPEIVKDEDIKERIYALLNYNLIAYNKVAIMNTIDGLKEYKCSKQLFKDSKKLIKYIKSYTR